MFFLNALSYHLITGKKFYRTLSGHSPVLRFREYYVTDRAKRSNNLLLGLCQIFTSLGANQFLVVEENVQPSMNKGNVKAKVLRPFSPVAALNALLLVG